MSNTLTKDMVISRDLTEQVKEYYPDGTWLEENFIVYDTKKIYTDKINHIIKTGTGGLAPYVGVYEDGGIKPGTQIKFTEYQPVQISEGFTITPFDAKARMIPFLSTMNQPNALFSAIQEIETDELADIVPRFTRRYRKMAFEVITTGQLIVQGEGVDMIIDMQFATNQFQTLTGTSMWSDQTNSTPFDDLKNWKKIIRGNRGSSNAVVMGEEASRHLFRHPDFKDRFLGDVNYVRLEFKPEMIDEFTTHWGTCKETGLKFYTNNETWYDEKNGVDVPYVPTDSIILCKMGDEQSKIAIKFAQIFKTFESIRAGLNSGERVSIFFEETKKEWKYEAIARALALPYSNKNFLTAKVV